MSFTRHEFFTGYTTAVLPGDAISLAAARSQNLLPDGTPDTHGLLKFIAAQNACSIPHRCPHVAASDVDGGNEGTAGTGPRRVCTTYFDAARAQLRRGRKTSHWIWFLLPQVVGLSSSPTSRLFAMSGLAQAAAYLNHPLLRQRLLELAAIVERSEEEESEELMGGAVDAQKLRSCMTLFLRVVEHARTGGEAVSSREGEGGGGKEEDELETSLFAKVLKKYWDGEPDRETDQILADQEARKTRSELRRRRAARELRRANARARTNGAADESGGDEGSGSAS